MSETNRLDQLAILIVPVLKKYQVSRAGLFGSVLRSDFSDQSDIDLLVELDDHNITSYFDLKSDLETELQRPVDVVQYDRLHKRIKNQVLSEQVALSL